jgi:hypothetical protein
MVYLLILTWHGDSTNCNFASYFFQNGGGRPPLGQKWGGPATPIARIYGNEYFFLKNKNKTFKYFFIRFVVKEIPPLIDTLPSKEDPFRKWPTKAWAGPRTSQSIE